MEETHSPFATHPSPSPVVLLWSGGKDAMMTLAALREQPDCCVAGLLTTVVEPEGVVQAHGVSVALLRAQAEALDLPLQVMPIPVGVGNEAYEAALAEALRPFREAGVTAAASGDLFLEDLRAYRERVLARIGFSALFPLWRQDTAHLARRFLQEGYRAVVTAVHTDHLAASSAGRFYDEAFLDELPEDVDPCGENGAFHTFVFDGPAFRQPLPITCGERYREGATAYVQLS